MSAQVHDFPTPPEFEALLQARANRLEILASANAILDNQSRHDDEAIANACIALCKYSDGYDQLRGETEMYLLGLRQRRERHDAARLAVLQREAPRSTGRIRRALGVLAGAVAAVSLAWLATEVAAAGIAGVML